MEQTIKVYVLAAVALVFALSMAVFSRDKRKNGIAFLLGWCVPGLGHLFLGRWRKALFVFAALGTTYLFGLWLTGFHTVGFDLVDVSPLYDGPGQITALLAANIIYEFLCTLTKRVERK
jgi:hypothetical protein